MKRLFDFFSSLVVLILLSPFLLVMGVIISLDSPGGPFYKQVRVGRHGKEFLLFKFRSMRPGSDQKGLITVGENDSRITRVGQFIRRYKIDELPQLINILLGDMSVVGPRPEVPKYVALYTDDQLRVLSVRPGLTDYASLEYFNENEILARANEPMKVYVEEILPRKLSLNLKYIEERSFWLDLKIIGRTIARIFS